MPGRCAVCNKDGGHACSGCINTPFYLDDFPDEMTYCSVKCQKSHWSVHKERCKALQNRKALHRAASLIQQIYFLARRRSISEPYGDIEYVGSETAFVHLRGIRKEDKNTALLRLPAGLSEADQLSLLAHANCEGAIALMGSSVEIILRSRNPGLLTCTY